MATASTSLDDTMAVLGSGTIAASGVRLVAFDVTFNPSLVFHRLLALVRTAPLISLLLSWKKRCRSPPGRTTAVRDVSLRMYCGGAEKFGVCGGTVASGFGALVGFSNARTVLWPLLT